MQMKERITYIDFASGIMILWMIIYHAIHQTWCFELGDYWNIRDLTSLPEGAKAFINSEGKLRSLNPCVLFPYLHFFMPWFFYKSGQFFTKQSIGNLWKKDWNKLLKTFLVWSLIGYVFYVLFGLLNDTMTLRRATYSVVRCFFLQGNIPLNGALWFLLTLFSVRFVANFAMPERGGKNAVLKIVSVVLFGYVVSYLAYRFNHRLLPYWVANGAVGLTFFSLGYALRDWEQKWWIVVPCFVVYIMGCIFGFPMVDMLSNELLKGEYCLWIPVALCCIVVFNALCRRLCKLVSIKPFEWIGKNAMLIYVPHYLIVCVVVNFFQLINLRIVPLGMFGVLMFSYVLLLIGILVFHRIKLSKL